jgi:hypothetical protein
MAQTRSELRSAISSARGYVLNALEGVTDGTYDGHDAEVRDIANDILTEALDSLWAIEGHLVAGHRAHQDCAEELTVALKDALQWLTIEGEPYDAEDMSLYEPICGAHWTLLTTPSGSTCSTK